ncbi:MAG: ATP-binding cassette domain-containing protein [Candidatus Binatia bacterium]
MSDVVRARNVVLYQGDRPLTRPISFAAQAGQVLRITGQNGVGKTTLLRTLLGAHQQWLGDLELKARGVAYLSQAEVTFATMTLQRLLPLVVGQRAERTREICERLKISDKLMSTAMGVLSGGQLRRAQLAIALAREHDLLLLDEPLSGIDEDSRNEIWDCICVQSATAAVVVVEHQLRRRPTDAAFEEVTVESVRDDFES